MLEWTESAAAADRCEGVNEASDASERTDGGAAECAEGGVGGGAALREAILSVAGKSAPQCLRPARREQEIVF